MPITRATRRQPRTHRRDKGEADEGAQEEEEEEEEEREEEEDLNDGDESDDDKQKKAARGGRPTSSCRRGVASTSSKSSSSTTPTNNPTTRSTVRSTSENLLSLVGGVLLVIVVLICTAFWMYIIPHAQKIDYRKTKMNPHLLHKHCQEQVGEPRVEEVAEGVFMAMGYDLANTILIRTSEGHIVVRSQENG